MPAIEADANRPGERSLRYDTICAARGACHRIRTEKIPFIRSRAAVPVLFLTSLILKWQ